MLILSTFTWKDLATCSDGVHGNWKVNGNIKVAAAQTLIN
jgi:hypothetical protein